MVRFMIDFTNLSIYFWGYALKSIYYILNKVSSKSVNKTPYEIWIGHKPVVSHFKVWRCPAYVKCLKTNKLGSRSDKYLFIEYPKETKRYYFYLVDEQKVFISLRIIFLKKKFLGIGINATKVELDEVRQVEESIPTTEPTELDLIRSNFEPVLKAPLRRYGRIPHQPDRYYSFLV